MMSMAESDSALAVIRRAIQNEIAGQRFYSEAAFYCVDPWAKEVFANLAREEEEHTQLLLVEYAAFEAQGQWVDPSQALGGQAGVEITQFTFSEEELDIELFPPQWAVGDAVDRRADDLAALAFGVRMEQKAIDLYRREGASTLDPFAQQAYSFLVEEEIRHCNQLKEHWERLTGTPFSEH